MSKMTQIVKELNKESKSKTVTNFMGGTSYEINPIDTMKLITASSIFGEPQYYRDGEFSDGTYKTDSLVKAYSVFQNKYEGLKTSEIMETVIDEALAYNFGEAIQWAKTLREEYYMRLNPQIIMVRAAIHKDREAFTTENPGKFNEISSQVMRRGDEASSQLTYWLYKNLSKNHIPSILKRSWAKKLSSMNRYEINKYKNKGIGLIDTIRISHAKSRLIDELMKNGFVEIETSENTWESLRSSGASWKKILKDIKLPHMALLRNLRNIFEEINDVKTCDKVMNMLKAGVLEGKQFPFRYFNAMKIILDSEVNHKSRIVDVLEICIDISRENMPRLKGKTMCLSDNSGSAWGTCNSEYGKVTIAEIANLSSVITAQNSEEGYVGKFGDKLKIYPITKRNGALAQTLEITRTRDTDVGGSTENGIWLFFDNAIKNKEHWDNIFIYSDQQAGHGGLFGLNSSKYKEYQCKGGRYIDVMKLIARYRAEVNPKVNVFSVQTAGYNNVLIPEYSYRTNILYGWTGKELLFADTIIKFWDSKEKV